MIRCGKILSLCWLLLAAVFPARGAGWDYLLDVWSSENGLPDSSVTAVTQTPDGYLWVGTYNGLARFDGVRFVTFDPANTPALLHARVRKLFVDARGTLWINTYDGSLTTLRDGRFTLELRNSRLSAGDLMLVSATTNEITFLTGRGDIFRKHLTAKSGEGWDELSPPGRGLGSISCEDAAGTIWYRDGDGQLWRLKGNQFESLPTGAGLEGQSVNCLVADDFGNIWVGTDREVARWDGGRFQTVLPVEPAPGVTCLTVVSSNQLWAVVNGSIGAAVDGRWVFKPDAKRNVFSGTSGRIGTQADHHGGMWFYNYGRGLLHATASGQIRQLTTDDGFPGERVYCLFEDTEGSWWAGLDAVGLVRVRERLFRTVATENKNLAHPAKSVCEDENGAMWFGLLSSGLGRWQDDSFTTFPVTGSTGGGSVFCVSPDAHGRLWLSAGDEDLFIREGEEIRRVLPVVHGVKAILADRAGRVWIGTTSGLLVATNGSPESIEPFKSVTRRNIRALAEDPAGNLWVGTGTGDLFCVTTNKVTGFRPADNHESGAIWSVFAEADGTVWLGTFRGGLLRLRDGKFTRFGKRDGLPDNVIGQILDDGRGNLWLGSHQGIFRVTKTALDDFARGKIKFIPCIDYARADGLPSLECSGGYQPAAWRNRDGQLWFTTARGATWIQPEDIKPNDTPPPVVIEEVLVDGRTQDLPADASQAIFKIPPGKHQIEFRYTGLSLASPERVQFRYKLSGVDADWVLAGTRRSVQYNLLPPGDYRFRVIACNSDGVWNETGAKLAIKILPHFYETWWFRLLVIAAILAIVIGTVRHTATKRLRLKMEQLERRQVVERERARIAKDIHDDLGASLTLIAVLGDLAQKEKTSERIGKISGTARDAVKSLDEIVWAVNPRNDTLSHLVDYTGQFATDYLRDAGIRCLLDVPDQMPAREVPANVRHNVFLVVKEALQNIVKHAHATEVWLHVSTSDSGLKLTVEDNGCGFEQAPENAWADGLRNMRQRLTEIGGECQIHSNPGKGTTISVELPLPAP
ncbi:MAG TPA: two-component regulator propeller domain-containing protein [bacterium]|nr:two-component regulator propeller domain-containing protein [bacterium]